MARQLLAAKKHGTAERARHARVVVMLGEMRLEIVLLLLDGALVDAADPLNRALEREKQASAKAQNDAARIEREYKSELSTKEYICASLKDPSWFCIRH